MTSFRDEEIKRLLCFLEEAYARHHTDGWSVSFDKRVWLEIEDVAIEQTVIRKERERREQKVSNVEN